MKSAKIDVGYVAQLAGLRLTPAEQVQFQGELDTVLAYVAKIGELDIAGIEPTVRVVSNADGLRDDVPDVRTPEIREMMLANAPERSGDEFKVPRILEQM